jgi:4,5-DOPA dioxygenase extradiol
MPPTNGRMPVLFVGHGSPMNAIEDSAFGREWARVGRELPRPEAILCISAHWETGGIRLTGLAQPKTVHDFYGFPPALYAQQYPAPGSPALAQKAAGLLPGAMLDVKWGLDHGTWSVLSKMYPKADIPVVQLSLDTARTPDEHHRLARKIAPLRDEGVLVMGSGNIVHNLRLADPSAGPFEWAVEFDRFVKGRIEARDHDALIHYERLGDIARYSIPTNEHYLPMLYALALAGKDDSLAFFNDSVTYGSLSMRSFILGSR